MRIFSRLGSALLAMSLLGALTVATSVAAADDAAPAPAVPADAAVVRLTVQGSAFANTAPVDVRLTITGIIPFSGAVQIVDGTAGHQSPLYDAKGLEATSALYTGAHRVMPPKTGHATGRRTWTGRFLTDTEGVGTASSESVSVDIHFWDAPPGSAFYEEILWFGGAGISTGYGDLGFHPGASVARDSLAAFLFRLQHPGAALPSCRTAPFPDVPVRSPFCGAIAWAADAGITTGFADGTYRPGLAVDRQSLAVMLFRMMNPGVPLPACTAPAFKDSGAALGAAACAAIAWMKVRKLTNGYPDGTFRPNEKVARDAFAAVAYRALRTPPVED